MLSSIVIVTRNRREVAANAISSAISQQGDVEVLVVDDGSIDDTSTFLREKFPLVQVQRFERQAGYIVRRNQAFAAARGEIIFSIDDDAILTEPTIVQDILKSFHEPRVGAVAIPFVNSIDGQDRKDFADSPDQSTLWVKSSFIGTAFALRKDVFIALGGFRENFFHWGEESEYCQRLFAAGYVVCAGNSALIRHFPAGIGKYHRKINRYIYRNTLLAVFFNSPAGYLLPLLALGTTRPLLKMLGQPHTIAATLEGLWMGYRDLFRYRRERRPINRVAFDGWLAVRKARFVPLSRVATLPMRVDGQSGNKPFASASAQP